MSTKVLLPGSKFPSLRLPLAGGGETDVGAVRAGHVAKLIVVYRGQFCPFCKATLAHVKSKVGALKDSKFDVVAMSADSPETTAAYLKRDHDGSLGFDVACSLTSATMHALGLYVSDPKNYQPQTYPFAEPAFFVLDADGTIRYRAESSFPAGARADVDNILAAYGWSQQNAIEHPEYAGHVWGAKKE